MKNRLEVLRAEYDWTQAALADALDVATGPSTPSKRARSTRAEVPDGRVMLIA